MVLLLAFAAVPAAFAVPVDGLYSAEVPVDPADPESRNTAYERALAQVLVRVTGSEDAAFSPELAGMFPNPARFVLQYRPGADNTLWVSFDGQALEQVLKQRGWPVWGNERPLTVVWLAVDWGQGDRELIGAAPAETVTGLDPRAVRRDDLRRRIERVAQARGLPIAFPDAALLADASVVDAWGGFHDSIREASRTLGATSVLVGRLRPTVAERNRWAYYFGADERQWSGDPEDALHLLADTLAARFAFAGNAPVQTVALRVSNLRSVRDYAAVQQAVGGLQLVESVRIDLVEGDRVRYLVRVNGGGERLAAALDATGTLERRFAEPGEIDPAAGAPGLSYAYRP